MRMAKVPGSQRSLWLGHADQEESRTTSRSYGEFDPVYLKDAADATDAYLRELNKRTDRNLFATFHCKSIAKRPPWLIASQVIEIEIPAISRGKMVEPRGIEPLTSTLRT